MEVTGAAVERRTVPGSGRVHGGVTIPAPLE